MDLSGVFDGINPGKLLVYLALLLFSVLFSLRLDGVLLCSYWFVFIPLWVWKVTTFSGAIWGVIAWSRHREASRDLPQLIQFKAMVISTSLHVLLALFEILACIKLESMDSSLQYWSLVFIPVFLLSLVSHVLCVWACRNERAFELELFFAVNTLQFIFIPIKLDGIIVWNWVFVFVPLWITCLVCFIFTMYIFLLARSQEVMPDQRKLTFKRAINYTCVIIPFVLFLVIFTEKMDSGRAIPVSVVAVPLYLTFCALIVTAFSAEGGNMWWFGLRKDCCRMLLDAFPLLREYGNVAYRMHSEDEQEDNRSSSPSLEEQCTASGEYTTRDKRSWKKHLGPPVVPPALSINTPD